MLARLRHPNVCLFLGCCLEPPTCYAIVTELVPRGSLWDVLREPRLNPLLDNGYDHRHCKSSSRSSGSSGGCTSSSNTTNESDEELPRRLLGLLPPPYCALPLPLPQTSSPDTWYDIRSRALTCLILLFHAASFSS